MKEVFSFDVCLKHLEGLRGNKYSKVKAVMDLLKSFWFERQGGSDPGYWDRVRVGTIDVYLDDENHLDFVTRFHLDNEPELVKQLEKLMD